MLCPLSRLRVLLLPKVAGGYEERPDWPKMGPSLFIATCLILAIRTTKRPAVFNSGFSNTELETEIKYSPGLARRVFSALIGENDGISRDAKNLGIDRTARIGRSAAPSGSVCLPQLKLRAFIEECNTHGMH